LDNARLFEEAREAVRRRDEFLAVLAHELRNPLAPIAHSAAIMRIKAAGLPDLTRLIDVVERQSRQMARLLDDLLDVARVTRGAIRLERCPIDLRGVLEQAAQSCGPLLLERRHRLDLALPPRPIAVEGDATRLEQVFVNLINNAAHYTPPGGTIQVEAFEVGPLAEVHVRDNGIGMTPETISRVFELFVHGEWEPTKTHEGLGVGLSLVRKLVEMHGGTVSAASPGPERGSEFSIRLPALDRSLDADLAVPETPRDPTSGLRIVLIEDVADNREMLRDLLELWGHHVETAADGESGLELIRRSKPDLALVDVGLPGMSGLELAQQAASDPDLARTFLVALTGFAQTEDRRQAREAGFAAHIVKPVNLEELLQILARADMRSGGEPEY
jgi:CheY-like chemotaxis protein